MARSRAPPAAAAYRARCSTRGEAGRQAGLTSLHGLHYAQIGGWAVIAGATGLVAMSALTFRIGEHGNFNVLKPYYAAWLAEGFPAQVRRWITRITSRDFFAFACFLLTLVGLPQVALVGFAFFTTLWVILILVAAPGLLRQAARSSDPRQAATT
jgi:hypothetical protein